jgi:hypothetical protein
VEATNLNLQNTVLAASALEGRVDDAEKVIGDVSNAVKVRGEGEGAEGERPVPREALPDGHLASSP